MKNPSSIKKVSDKKTTHRSSSYSIEYAHIYTDEKVNGNHFESIAVLKDVKSTIVSPYSKVVLIDNYNADSDKFNVEHFLSILSQKGGKPDFYAFESDLVPLADVLLDSIEKPKVARMYKSYIARKGKYPCSLLTATWYLVRLGRIDGKDILYRNNRDLSLKNAVAEKLINILPSSFADVEKETHKLIGYSKFWEDRFKIEPILFHEEYPTRDGFVPESVSMSPGND